MSQLSDFAFVDTTLSPAGAEPRGRIATSRTAFAAAVGLVAPGAVVAAVGDAPAAWVTAMLRDALRLVLWAPHEPAAVQTLVRAVGVHAREMDRVGLPRQTTIEIVRSAIADLLEHCRTRPSSAVVALVLWRCVRWALAPTA